MSDERDPIEPEQIAAVEAAQVRIRRAPKLRVFVAIGVVVVELVTVIATLQFPADPSVGMTATVGYMSIYGVGGGALLGAVVALVVDAVSRRTARTVNAERAVLAEPDEPAQPQQPADPSHPAASQSDQPARHEVDAIAFPDPAQQRP